MSALKSEIASLAAQWVVEEGLDYRAAKQRAVKALGLPNRTALPDNEALETAVIDHIAVFCADSQAGELRALRELALTWMERMAGFRPYIAGAVWRGTATRLSDIYIQLFCDDSKSAEIFLINFWATWCPPCIEELPLLSRFYQENASKSWQLLGIAVDQPEAVNRFLAQSPVSFPVALAGFAGIELSKTLGNLSGALPFTVVLAGSGAVAHRKMGRITSEDLSAWSALR